MKFKFLVAISLIVLGLVLIFNRPDNRARLIFCDVGQGDGAILIKGTFELTIDSGPANRKMIDCLEKHLPFGDKTIEVAIISHWDSDHSGGLKQMMSYYTIEKLYANEAPKDENEQKMYTANLAQLDILRSSWFDFEVVNPTRFFDSPSTVLRVAQNDNQSDNDRSVVGILTVGQRQILFTGDASSEVEQRLVWKKQLVESLKSESPKSIRRILKVSHHGSKTGTSEELLMAFRPQLAVISVGKNNRYGHPSAEVVERLKADRIEVWRTDEMGELEVGLEESQTLPRSSP